MLGDLTHVLPIKEGNEITAQTSYKVDDSKDNSTKFESKRLRRHFVESSADSSMVFTTRQMVLISPKNQSLNDFDRYRLTRAETDKLHERLPSKELNLKKFAQFMHK